MQNGTVATLYVNAKPQTQNSLTAGHNPGAWISNIFADPRILRLGRWGETGNAATLRGLLKNFYQYNRPLSESELEHNLLNYTNPVASGLILWIPCEEGAGEIVYDKSGHGNYGMLLPAGRLGPTWERLRQWEIRAQTE